MSEVEPNKYPYFNTIPKKKRVGFTFYLQLQNNVVYSVRNVGLVPTSSQCLPIVCTYRAVFLTNWIYDGV